VSDRETERREWQRIVRDLLAREDDAPTPAATPETPDERLPTHPSALRSVHRLSVEDQDEWSNRMKNRYGGEW
jgi:hypothetical protein